MLLTTNYVSALFCLEYKLIRLRFIHSINPNSNPDMNPSDKNLNYHFLSSGLSDALRMCDAKGLNIPFTNRAVIVQIFFYSTFSMYDEYSELDSHSTDFRE